MNSIRNQRLCAWSGLVFLAVIGVAFCVVAPFFPPWAPSETAEQVAARYQEHATGIRLGVVLMMFSAALWLPFIIVIWARIRAAEDRSSVLATCYLVSGAMQSVVILIACVAWGAAAYRPARAPEITQALNDVAWLGFIAPVSCIVLMWISLGVLILQDTDRPPVFARWIGYFTVWVGILPIPGGLAFLFHDGPLAWSGVFAFWIPFTGFTWWIVVLAVVLLRDPRGQSRSVL